MLENVKNLLSDGVTALGGILIVFGLVNLGLTIKDGMQGGGGQLSGALAMIIGGAIVDMLFRLGSRCHNERVGDINGMAAGITVIVAIERGDGLLFHLIALPVEDEVLEDGDGRCAHGFSFLPWGGSTAVPLADYKYSRLAYQQTGEPYTPYILHIKAWMNSPMACLNLVLATAVFQTEYIIHDAILAVGHKPDETDGLILSIGAQVDDETVKSLPLAS